YGHVTSKQQLLYELVKVGYDEHRRWIREALLDSGPDPEDQLRALARAHVMAHLTYPDLAKVTTRVERALDEQQRELLTAVLHDSEQVVLNVIERGVRLGRFHVDEPVLAIAAIAAMGVRAAERLSGEVPWAPEQIADTYAEYAL